MGNWFGDLDLAVKYAIGLGSLVALVSIFASIKLFLQKRKIRLIRAEIAAKAADEEHKIDQVALTQREQDEGDLFGIRAIEKGFYGGVAQSRPTTPTGSVPTLVGAYIPYGHGSRQQSQLSTTTIGVDSAGRNSAVDPVVNMNQAVPDSPLFAPKDYTHSDGNSTNSKHLSASSSISPNRLPAPLTEVEQPARVYVRTPRIVATTDSQPVPVRYSESECGGSDTRPNSPGSNRNSGSPPRTLRPSGSPPAPIGIHPALRPPTPRDSLGAIYNTYYREGVNSGFDFAAAPGTAPGSDGKTSA